MPYRLWVQIRFIRERITNSHIIEGKVIRDISVMFVLEKIKDI